MFVKFTQSNSLPIWIRSTSIGAVQPPDPLAAPDSGTLLSTSVGPLTVSESPADVVAKIEAAEK